MDDKTLEEIRAREQAATPGPWFCHESHNWHKDPPKEYFVITRGMRTVVASWVESADAQFVAHAREDVPSLLDEIDRLNAKVVALEAEVKHRAKAEAEGRLIVLPRIVNGRSILTRHSRTGHLITVKYDTREEAEAALKARGEQ